MAIYSSLDITSPIGTSSRIITEKDFFKSIILFGSGNTGLTDAQISTYASAMIASGTPIGGFPYLDGDSTYEENRCLPHFQLNETSKYWYNRKNNNHAPWITSSNVIDYTSVRPFSSTVLMGGAPASAYTNVLMPDMQVYDPFKQHVAYYNYLFNNIKLELTTDDGGLNVNTIKVKISGFTITDYSNGRYLATGGSQNVANGGSIAVNNRNLYLNYEDTVQLQCTFRASANTSTTLTYKFTGKPKLNVQRHVNGADTSVTGVTILTSSTALNNTAFSATTSNSYTNLLGTIGTDKLPVKMALVLNVVRNINWLNIDVSHLTGKTIDGITLTADNLNLSSPAGYLSGFTQRVVTYSTSTGVLSGVTDSASTETQYEVWPVSFNAGNNYIARINTALVKKNTGGYPGIQLYNGLFLCSTYYGSGTTASGMREYSYSLGRFIDEYLEQRYNTIRFFSGTSRIYMNRYIHNKTSIGFYLTTPDVDGLYLSPSYKTQFPLRGGNISFYGSQSGLKVRLLLDNTPNGSLSWTSSTSTAFTQNLLSYYGKGCDTVIIEPR